MHSYICFKQIKYATNRLKTIHFPNFVSFKKATHFKN